MPTLLLREGRNCEGVSTSNFGEGIVLNNVPSPKLLRAFDPPSRGGWERVPYGLTSQRTTL